MISSTVAVTTGATSAAAAMAQAIKASGALVYVDIDAFKHILSRIESPLIVMTQGGFITKNFQYMTNYKGITFFTKINEEMLMPPKAELIYAKKFWMPA